MGHELGRVPSTPAVSSLGTDGFAGFGGGGGASGISWARSGALAGESGDVGDGEAAGDWRAGGMGGRAAAVAAGNDKNAKLRKEVLDRLTEMLLSFRGVRKIQYNEQALQQCKARVKFLPAAQLPPDMHLLEHKLLKKERKEVTPLEAARQFFMSSLNKLSAENYDVLKKTLIDYNVVSHAMFEAVVQVVFDKALDDVKFQDIYARLCLELGLKATESWGNKYLKTAFLSENQGPSGQGWYYTTAAGDKAPGTPLEEYEGWVGPIELDDTDAPQVKNKQGAMVDNSPQLKAESLGMKKVNFKRTIMDMCEKEFKEKAEYDRLNLEEAADAAAHERGELSKGDLEAHRAERAFARSRAKKRVMSNISFIGQLYIVPPMEYPNPSGKGGMLSTGSMVKTSIIRYCCSRLLHNGKTDLVEEEDIECLSRLLTLCGNKLEQEELNDTSKDAKQLVPVYMSLLSALSKDASGRLCSRVRFIAQGIVDMQKEGWKLRGAAATIEFQQRSVTKQEAREAVMNEENAHRQRLLEGSRGGPMGGQHGSSSREGRTGQGQDVRGVRGAPSGPGGLPAKAAGNMFATSGAMMKKPAVGSSSSSSSSGSGSSNNNTGSTSPGSPSAAEADAEGWQAAGSNTRKGTGMRTGPIAPGSSAPGSPGARNFGGIMTRGPGGAAAAGPGAPGSSPPTSSGTPQGGAGGGGSVGAGSPGVPIVLEGESLNRRVRSMFEEYCTAAGGAAGAAEKELLHSAREIGGSAGAGAAYVYASFASHSETDKARREVGCAVLPILADAGMLGAKDVLAACADFFQPPGTAGGGASPASGDATPGGGWGTGGQFISTDLPKLGDFTASVSVLCVCCVCVCVCVCVLCFAWCARLWAPSPLPVVSPFLPA